MPSIVVFAGVMVILLLSAVIWMNVKYFRQEKREEQQRAEPVHADTYELQVAQADELAGASHEHIVIDEERVPLFVNDPWKQVFYRLANEPEILGWIAFHNDIAGAGDKVYDNAFLSVLLSHQDAVKKVQKEAGLSAIHEMFMHGDAGDIWFVYVKDGVWFALFADPQASVHGLVKEIHRTLLSHI